MSDLAGHCERLLARLARGILHEISNPLNSILMNAELGLLMSSQDDAASEMPAILASIRDEARRGGAFARALGHCVAARNFAPQSEGDALRALSLGQRLATSLAREHNVRLCLECTGPLPALPLDEVAVALALAQILDLLIARVPEQISLSASTDGGAIMIEIRTLGQDGESALGPLPEPAATILADHGGTLREAGQVCELRLPTGTLKHGG